MGVTSRKYASVIFVCSIAFLMIAPLQVIDVYAAVPATMSAPTVSSYTDVSVTLAFVAPSSDESITDYLIKQSPDDSTFTLVTTPTSTALTEEIVGLIANTTYYFKVAAVSSDGTGTYSASKSQKTLGVLGGGNYTEKQTYSEGQEFGAGSTFTDGQLFTGGIMTFGTGQTFGANTAFAPGQGFTSAQTFGTGAEFGAGTTFGAAQTFGENMDFSAGTQTFSAAQTFSKGATFGTGQTFGAGEAHDFTGESLTFEAGTDFGVARTFGEAMTFTGVQNFDDDLHVFGADALFTAASNFADGTAFPVGASFASGQEFDVNEDYTFAGFMDFAGAPEFGKARTFGEGTFFSGSASPDMGTFANIFAAGGHMPDSQAFTVAQTFGENMHFGDNTDFTGFVQTFKAGAHFGDGTTFKVGQEMPADTVPSYGLMLEAFTCTDAACVPPSASAYLAPGEFLNPGVDPDPISSSITKDSKAIQMDGLGFAMTFNGTVGTAGTITTDPIDPATLTQSSSMSTTGARSVTGGDGQFETIGTMLNVSKGTAVTTGTMDITIEYDESNIPSGQTEAGLEFIHYVGGEWIAEDTCTQDTTLNTITCTVSTLSPVGIGSPNSGGSSSSGSTCTQCKVLKQHGGFAINDQTYTLIQKYTTINTNEVKTGEPVTITLSVANASGAPRVTSTIIYMDLYGSPNNYKQSSSISYSPSVRDKININDIGDLWTSVDVDSEIISHPIHQTAYRMNYTFTMIFDKPMDTSHIVLETTNHYGIPEVLYVTGALKVVENDASTYTDDVKLQEESEPEVILQSAPEPEVVIEPELVIDTEPAFMSNTITSLVIDLEPIPSVLAEPTVDTEPLIDPEPKQIDFFAWLASLFS